MGIDRDIDIDKKEEVSLSARSVIFPFRFFSNQLEVNSEVGMLGSCVCLTERYTAYSEKSEYCSRHPIMAEYISEDVLKFLKGNELLKVMQVDKRVQEITRPE